MKKIIYLLLLLLVLSQIMFAQGLPINEVGRRFNDVQRRARAQADNEPIGINPQAETERQTYTFIGFKLGVGITDIDGGDPELFRSWLGGIFGLRMMFIFNNVVGITADIEYESLNVTGKYWIFGDTTKLDFIGTNVMFTIKFGGGFLGAGFYTKFLLSAKMDYYDSSKNVIDNFNSVDFGFIITLGLIFNIGPAKLFSGFEVRQGITNISNNTPVALRTQGYYLTTGVGF